MLEFGTYVETTTDCIRARVWVRGFRVDAVVLGWSGIVVHLTWRSDMGAHLGWVPAADVERR
jgi:hypothetical protein